jgi:hypothetical protein
MPVLAVPPDVFKVQTVRAGTSTMLAPTSATPVSSAQHKPEAEQEVSCRAGHPPRRTKPYEMLVDMGSGNAAPVDFIGWIA